jgi:hypothetical protein
MTFVDKEHYLPFYHDTAILHGYIPNSGARPLAPSTLLSPRKPEYAVRAGSLKFNRCLVDKKESSISVWKHKNTNQKKTKNKSASKFNIKLVYTL